MAGKSSKNNNRGSDLFGYFASGKHKEYHTISLLQDMFNAQGLSASGGVISDLPLKMVMFIGHTSLLHQGILMLSHYWSDLVQILLNIL